MRRGFGDPSAHQSDRELAGRLNPGFDLRVSRSRAALALHSAIKVCDRPGVRLGVPAETRDEMQMEMAGSLSKGDRIHPVTTADLFDQKRGALNGTSPIRGFRRIEVSGASEMTSSIKQTPTDEWRWMGMVPKQPVLVPPDLEMRKRGIIVMNAADSASRAKRLNRLAHSHSPHETE